MARRTVATVDWSPDRKLVISRTMVVLRGVAEAAVRESAQFVLDRELATVPVATGKTKAGLSIEDEDSGDGLFSSTVAERDPLRAHVAFFLNKGTRHMAARPFADDAVNAERRRLSRRVTRRVRAELGTGK